jgi:DnaJ-class molecular chaperone
VPLRTAVLGGTITTETIHGPVTIKVPKYASSGTTLRLKGKGITGGSGAPGDHFVKLLITLPEPTDSGLVRALEDWAAQTAEGKEDK